MIYESRHLLYTDFTSSFCTVLSVLWIMTYFEISEGIDFSDNESRGVIVIGIPYAPTTNPRIELKKQFLTKQRIGIAKEELKKVNTNFIASMK